MFVAKFVLRFLPLSSHVYRGQRCWVSEDLSTQIKRCLQNHSKLIYVLKITYLIVTPSNTVMSKAGWCTSCRHNCPSTIRKLLYEFYQLSPSMVCMHFWICNFQTHSTWFMSWANCEIILLWHATIGPRSIPLTKGQWCETLIFSLLLVWTKCRSKSRVDIETPWF